MRFLIYGAGALGQALGCMLACDGHEVDLVLRKRFIDAIEPEGLMVAGIFGEYHAKPGAIGLFPSIEPALKRFYDFALITTKTYDTDGAIDDVSRLCDQSFPVASLQNGCGNLEKVVARFGEGRALAGRVITGFAIERPGLVRITVTADAVHIGGARVGQNPDADRLAASIDGSGLPCIAVPDVRKDLHAKLLYNCALNPLGAVLGVHYGALADDEATREIMNRVLEETFAVISAMGGATPWTSATEYRRYFYEKQIPATYHHRPSMLQDLESGKPTEVEALTGYVATMGDMHGVETPACDLLSRLVRFKERQARKK